MYKILVLTCLLFSMPTLACDKKAALHALENYIWLTEDYPPYNFYDKEGKIVGMSVDILELVFQELDLDLQRDEIRLIPWARLVRDMKVSNKFAAFTMVNTKERAALYTLVATPLPTMISVMALDEDIDALRNKPIKNLSIAVVREDIGQISLNLKKFESEQIMTTSHQSMVNMLYRHRVDAIAFNEELVKYLYNKDVSPEHTIRTLYVLQDQLINNYVFHKSAPTCVTELFTQTLDKLEQSGKIEKIKQQYLPDERLQH